MGLMHSQIKEWRIQLLTHVYINLNQPLTAAEEREQEEGLNVEGLEQQEGTRRSWLQHGKFFD
jgi:hypothetical protein